MKDKPTYEELERELLNCRLAEGKAQRARRFMEGVLNAMDDSVFVKNDKHERLFSNDANCKQLGLSKDQLHGKTDRDYLRKAEADVFWAKDCVVLETGKTNLNQEPITFADGSSHVISTKKSLYVDQESGEKYIVGISRDVTEQVTLEEKHKKQIEDLNAAVTKIDALKSLVPICSCCKKVRDDAGYLKQVEEYIRNHRGDELGHGLCPDCAKKR